MTFDPGKLHVEFTQLGLRCELRVPLSPLTTYGVGGAAEIAVWASHENEVVAIASVLAKHVDVPVQVVGRGSNLLVADDGFSGVAVIMSTPVAQTQITVDGDLVSAPGTMNMPVLARRSAAAGRGGLEWCVGIPGTVGGAVRMNAGGHGAEMVDSLQTATLVSLKSAVSTDISVQDLGLHFRGSALAPHHVVVNATFATAHIDPEIANKEIDAIVAWRRDNQPGGRNAGSVFVNPAQGEGSAGALIDSAGLRGYSVGGASISDKHANFIQAAETATASDIVAAMKHAQDVVEKQHGITLRSEVQLVGFTSQVAERFVDPSHSNPERVEAARHLAKLMGEQS